MMRNRKNQILVLLAFSLIALGFIASKVCFAEDDLCETIVARGIEYMRSEGQAEDGSFTSYAGIGPTALITTALLRNGLGIDDPMTADALAFLEQYVQVDGGIYNPEGLFRNYETCLTMMCFTEANEDGRYDETLSKAEQFIRGLQWDEGEDRSPDDAYYGGAGYGEHGRPDMSNTTFFVEAMNAVGVDEDDEALQRALVFISRCQNLETEHNTTPFAAKNPDGGFYYTAAAGGESKAGETPNGGLRSYASMTYAGLKSMIHAGVEVDDPRVKAAVAWIEQHYTLEENPGMEAAGLYYYYNVFAKTMNVMEIDQFEDADGRTHDWKAEIVSELAERQQENGAWINDDNPRWLEGDPNLVTGYALMSLGYCR
jgi:squalene-hopene/tetraprenyl-beta-curcumene cyclase